MEEKDNNVVETTEKTGTQPENNVVEKTFTQKDFEETLQKELARKTKNLPSDEDLKAFKEWKEAQKTEQEKYNELQSKYTELENKNKESEQLIAVLKSNVLEDHIDFVRFEVAKQDGDFNENLKTYLENNKSYLKTSKPVTTGFSQNQGTVSVSEEKAYMDKKYANNPYYKK